MQKNRRYNKLQLFLKILILLSVLFTAYTGKIQTFTDIGAGLSGLSSATGAWGDYDNDGKLDILFRELNQLVIYRNFSATSNSAPSAPTGQFCPQSGWFEYQPEPGD